MEELQGGAEEGTLQVLQMTHDYCRLDGSMINETAHVGYSLIPLSLSLCLSASISTLSHTEFGIFNQFRRLPSGMHCTAGFRARSQRLLKSKTHKYTKLVDSSIKYTVCQ